MADALLQLHKLMDDKLLIPTQENQTIAAVALCEAGRLKKLMGYLRTVYRASDGSHCPKIRELKSLLRKKVQAGVPSHEHKVTVRTLFSLDLHQ